MFSLQVTDIYHYLSEPLPDWDVLNSSFQSAYVNCKVPVLCLLGATPEGRKICVHAHGEFPYLIVQIDKTQLSASFLQNFAANLDQAINATDVGNSVGQHVYKISLVSDKIEHTCKQGYWLLKIDFYNPDLVAKVADLLQDGAVMNTYFQLHGADIPFTHQFLINHKLQDVNAVHILAFKFRQAFSGNRDAKISRLARSAGDDDDTVAKHQRQEWQDGSNLQTILCCTSKCSRHTCSFTQPYQDVDNMSSFMSSHGSVEDQSECTLEIDVMAADIYPGEHCLGNKDWNVGDDYGHTSQCEQRKWLQREENSWKVCDSQSSESEVDDDCVMDIEDWDEDDDSDIPQLDGTSDEKPAPKKSSKKRAKSSKMGTTVSGTGSEEGSSQGEGSNLSASPVQSPLMTPARDVPAPRDQTVTSPYPPHQGYAQHEAGYYRHQQWGEPRMPANKGVMPSYPGYCPASVGWGQSPPPQGLYPALHRPPGNNYGYFPYPQHCRYSPTFSQSGSQRQHANFSPPSHVPMSPPSYPNSGPFPRAHAGSSPQQYSPFTSPPLAGISAAHPSSEDSASHQETPFIGPDNWQCPGSVFSGWGYSKGMNVGATHGMPSNMAHAVYGRGSQGMPVVSPHGMTAATSQGMPIDSKTSQSSDNTSKDVPGNMSAGGTYETRRGSSASSQSVVTTSAGLGSDSMPLGSANCTTAGSSTDITTGSTDVEAIQSPGGKPTESCQDVNAVSCPQGVQGMSPFSMAGGDQQGLKSTSVSIGSTHSMPPRWWSSPLPCHPGPTQNSSHGTNGQGQSSHVQTSTQDNVGQSIHLQNTIPFGTGEGKPGSVQNQNISGQGQSNVPPEGCTQAGPGQNKNQNPVGPRLSSLTHNIQNFGESGHPSPIPSTSEKPTAQQRDNQKTVGQAQTDLSQNSSMNNVRQQMDLVESRHQQFEQGQSDHVQTSIQNTVGQEQHMQNKSQTSGIYNVYQTTSGPSQKGFRQAHGPLGSPEAINCQTNTLTDHNRWHESQKSSPTLQALLKAPEINMGRSPNHSSSISAMYPRRAMSMDCAPSDFSISPSRSVDSMNMGRQAFKHPQKRSGSFSSPGGCMGGASGQSALSNLYNFVSSVDTMARTPTPTSRNSTPAPVSTPSSTPNSGPSPSMGIRTEESAGIMDMAVSQAKLQLPSFQPISPTTQCLPTDETSCTKVAQPPVSGSLSTFSGKDSHRFSVSTEQAVNCNIQQSLKQSVSLQTDDGDKVLEEMVMKQDKDKNCASVYDGLPFVGDIRGSKDTVLVNQTVVSSSSEIGRENPPLSRLSGNAVSSVRSDRLGKASRMKKLGLNLNRARRMSEDSIGNTSVTPVPCAAYNFTFHVPTPVYKRLKMHRVFSKRASEDIRFVRMHPMEARRYSLLKIGRELVRLTRLSSQDLTKKRIVSVHCTGDSVNRNNEHNSLIDPHTGELLFSLPSVHDEDGSKESLQSSTLVDKTVQSTHSHLIALESECKEQILKSEGKVQTSRANSDSYFVDSGVETQSRSGSDMLLTPESISYSVNTMGTCESPTDSVLTSESGGSNSHTWQTLDRDRRPSVKVEYPAQMSVNSEPWPCGQQPPNNWDRGVHLSNAGGHWGEQWHNSSNPSFWNSGANGGQSYYSQPVNAGGMKQPWTANPYDCSTWSGPHTGPTAPLAPSSSSSPSSSQSKKIVTSTNQRHIRPLAYSGVNYHGYSSGVHNQQIPFSSSSQHNSPNAVYMCNTNSNVGAVRFPYPGYSSQDSYQSGQNLGNGAYPNHPSSDYFHGMQGNPYNQPAAFMQQQQGGMFGQYQGNQQSGHYPFSANNPCNFQQNGGYFPSGPFTSLSNTNPQFSSHSNPSHPDQLTGQSHELPSSNPQDKLSSPTGQHDHCTSQQSQFSSPVSQCSNFGSCEPSHLPSISSHRDQDSTPDGQSSLTSAQKDNQRWSSQNESQEQLCKSGNPKTPSSVPTNEHLNQISQGKQEGSGSSMIQKSNSFANGNYQNTFEQDPFLQQVACQDSTSKGALEGVKNIWPDRPSCEKTLEDCSRISETYSKVKHKNKERINCNSSEPSEIRPSISSLDMGANCSSRKTQRKASSDCRLGDKTSHSAESKNQKHINGVSSPASQTVRRSSVQLWSDGDSDSGEEDSDENGESSDDYKPSSNAKRKGQKRKRSRRRSQSKVKRSKRSSVNYDAHAFSKYLDHGFEKKPAHRTRQNQSPKDRKSKKKGKGSSLIEGIHYIVVGKFKGNRIMLVKVDRLKMRLDERIKVSDWQKKGEHAKAKSCTRLQGPRCRRLAKGIPATDPSFVQPTDRIGSENLGEDSDASTVVEDDAKPKSPFDVKAQLVSSTEQRSTEATKEQTSPPSPEENNHSQECTVSLGIQEHPESKHIGNERKSVAKGKTIKSVGDNPKSDMDRKIVCQQSEMIKTAERSKFYEALSHDVNSAVVGDSDRQKPNFMDDSNIPSSIHRQLVKEQKEFSESQNDSAISDNQKPSPPAKFLNPGSGEENGSGDRVDSTDTVQVKSDNKIAEEESAPRTQSAISVQEDCKPVENMPSSAGSLALSPGRKCQ